MAPSREDRIRERLFQGVATFSRRGFTMLPILLRRAQFLFSPRGWQVYTYILMRTGKGGITWLTMAEMARDLDFNSIPKLRKYVEQLVADGWVLAKRSSAKEYFIAPDPYGVLRALAGGGRIPPDRREDLDELLDLLGEGTLTNAPAQEDDRAEKILLYRGAVYRRAGEPDPEMLSPLAQPTTPRDTPEEFQRVERDLGRVTPASIGPSIDRSKSSTTASEKQSTLGGPLPKSGS